MKSVTLFIMLSSGLNAAQETVAVQGHEIECVVTHHDLYVNVAISVSGQRLCYSGVSVKDDSGSFVVSSLSDRYKPIYGDWLEDGSRVRMISIHDQSFDGPMGPDTFPVMIRISNQQIQLLSEEERKAHLIERKMMKTDKE